MGNTSTRANVPAAAHPDARHLLNASMERDMEAAHTVLSKSVDHLHARGEYYRTPILLCVALGTTPVLYDSASRTQFLGYLLSRGARVSDQDQDGWTPLHHCAAVGDMHGVRLLIENGSDPDQTNNLGIKACDFLEREYIVPGHRLVPEYATDAMNQLRRSSATAKSGHSRHSNSKTSRTGFEDDGFLDGFENDNNGDDFHDVKVSLSIPGSTGTGPMILDQDDQDQNQCSWQLEFCSLRCPEVVQQGSPLIVEFSRGSDHCTSSFVQLYYVDERPWMLRKRLGSYQSLPTERQSGKITFNTKRLSANGKFRVLYHGKNQQVLCASNVFKIQEAGVSGKSLVAAALAASSISSTRFDEDEFSAHLEQDRSWGCPADCSWAKEYHDDILLLDESLWIAAMKNPPPTDFLFDLIMSKADIALAMADDNKLVEIRFRLVPCWMTEHEFWRVYFWKLTNLRKSYRTLRVMPEGTRVEQ